MKACLLPKMSIFNLRERGSEKEKMARAGGGGGAVQLRGQLPIIRLVSLRR